MSRARRETLMVVALALICGALIMIAIRRFG
jgi:hypothetical protein